MPGRAFCYFFTRNQSDVMRIKKKYPFYTQLDTMDCGPTCLKMITAYYGKNIPLDTLREKCHLSRNGVSLSGISDAAEKLGFRTLAVSVPFITHTEDQDERPSLQNIALPCIAHVNQQHYLVVYKVSDTAVYVADPAAGKFLLSRKEFEKMWLAEEKEGVRMGILLLFETTPIFYQPESLANQKTTKKLSFFFTYLKPYKKAMIQVLIGLGAGILLQLLFPFIAQAIVDIGIQNRNIGFVYLMLIAQVMLYCGQIAVEFIRSWILLHVTSRVNISLISDFLIKLMKLPVSFFDAKMTGDIMQRIGDNYRIQQFLTNSTLNTLFSVISFLVFGLILCVMHKGIFAVFIGFSALYTGWVILFLRKRKELDYRRFTDAAANQNQLIELLQGMQEIKLQNAEKRKRWEWEYTQARLFKTSIKGLELNQYQSIGATFINEIKNILISIIAAQSVINGRMTLGEMMSIQYIIGQLNNPISQMIGFVQMAQDARISLSRLAEIHDKEEEDNEENVVTEIPQRQDLVLNNVSFRYSLSGPVVLDNINLRILHSKVTAIVGTSGSGKTTLMKLLLKFYKPTQGDILLGHTPLASFDNASWREACGTVMQDGYIFSDTIARNITISDETVNKEKLLRAVKIANIRDFIEELPLKYNTKIGSMGNGISQGQRQRLLLARAAYKSPAFLFFDEATNALDSNNEKKIIANFESFFKGRTVVVVAHRLSTVRHADQIVVLDQGRIVELGTHEELVLLRGHYFELVKNQLELAE
jgi:ATP-binding cassette, subfamily B, bacterial